LVNSQNISLVTYIVVTVTHGHTNAPQHVASTRRLKIVHRYDISA